MLGDKSKKLFIHNLTTLINDSHLEEYFKRFGELEKAYSVFKKDDRKKGIGFVLFKNSKDADIALSQKSHFIQGQRIYVKNTLLKAESNSPSYNRNSVTEEVLKCKDQNESIQTENFSLNNCKGIDYSNFGSLNKEFLTNLCLSKSFKPEIALRCNFEMQNFNFCTTENNRQEIYTNDHNKMLESATNNSYINLPNNNYQIDFDACCKSFYNQKQSMNPNNSPGNSYSLF